MKSAIVYLAQNTRKDPQYGRDSRSMLEKSLDLLYENYNHKFKHPVLIFHEGDFGPADQEAVIAGRDEIEFHEVHFDVPSFLRKEEVPEFWQSQTGRSRFGMGHRHMYRFYSLLLFDILADLGYEWYMRLDDDSFVHSRIGYNLFEFMEKNDYEYGYRVDVQEGLSASYGFGETVLAYIKSERIDPAFFYKHVKEITTNDIARRRIKEFLLKIDPEGKFHNVRENNLSPVAREPYDRRGYYNNFHITRIAFWKRPEVQYFLHHMDRVGAAYKYRWGDLLIQSAAVQIFMPKGKVYKFEDWTYEHATIIGGKLKYGGIYHGTQDKDAKVVKAFRERYGAEHLDASTFTHREIVLFPQFHRWRSTWVRRAEMAWKAVHGEPIAKWPMLLRTLWLGRRSRQHMDAAGQDQS